MKCAYCYDDSALGRCFHCQKVFCPDHIERRKVYNSDGELTFNEMICVRCMDHVQEQAQMSINTGFGKIEWYTSDGKPPWETKDKKFKKGK